MTISFQIFRNLDFWSIRVCFANIHSVSTSLENKIHSLIEQGKTTTDNYDALAVVLSISAANVSNTIFFDIRYPWTVQDIIRWFPVICRRGLRSGVNCLQSRWKFKFLFYEKTVFVFYQL